MPYQKIYDAWEQEKPLYDELGAEVAFILKEAIYENGMYADVSYRTKDIVSILKKLRKKNESNTPYKFDDLTDKLGVRVICNYKDDIDAIHKIISNNFKVIKIDDKAEKLGHDIFNYTSRHFDLVFDKASDTDENKRIFELQLRTINQHAWACTAHELSYKQEIQLPNDFKRKIHRLVALYEIADDELNSVKNYVITHEDYHLFELFKKLEKYFYRLAKHPFDRSQSIIYIKQLVNFLQPTQRVVIDTELDKFVTVNTDKIIGLFKEYRSNPNYNFIILKPEIILTWFLLGKFEYSISENWVNHFDPDALEIIKNIWGVIE